MGGNRGPLGSLAARCAGALCIVVALAACTGDDEPASDVVEPADALTAAIAWQAGQQEPALDDDGEVELPVIFVVAGDGTEIDLGVQAEVAESTNDWATVRFADAVGDTFDAGLDGSPVRDDGAMLLVGQIPEPARSIELEVIRYTALDDHEPLTLEITVDVATDGTTVGTGADPAPRASVTSVMRS